MLGSIMKIRRTINPSLRISGILMTMVDGRTNNAKEIIAAIRQNVGTNIKVFNTEIPHSVRVAEASMEGKSIYTYDRKGKAGAAYEALTKEVLADEEREKNRSWSDCIR